MRQACCKPPTVSAIYLEETAESESNLIEMLSESNKSCENLGLKMRKKRV